MAKKKSKITGFFNPQKNEIKDLQVTTEQTLTTTEYTEAQTITGTLVTTNGGEFGQLLERDNLDDLVYRPIIEAEPTNIVNFAKVRPDATIPTKEDENAGRDVYACFDLAYMEIKPHETKLIPTGIASSFNPLYVALLKERGSTGTKGMGQRAGVIDSGYRGEWFVPITNHNEKTIVIVKDGKLVETDDFYIIAGVIVGRVCDTIIYPYEKAIAQVIFAVVPELTTMEITYDELKEIKSKRGTGCIGSSGK